MAARATTPFTCLPYGPYTKKCWYKNNCMCVIVIIHTHTNTAHCSSYSKLPRCGPDMAVSSRTSLTQVQLHTAVFSCCCCYFACKFERLHPVHPTAAACVDSQGPRCGSFFTYTPHSGAAAYCLVLLLLLLLLLPACRIGAAASWYQTDAACDDSLKLLFCGS